MRRRMMRGVAGGGKMCALRGAGRGAGGAPRGARYGARVLCIRSKEEDRTGSDTSRQCLQTRTIHTIHPALHSHMLRFTLRRPPAA
jgi:hypothetical protein